MMILLNRRSNTILLAAATALGLLVPSTTPSPRGVETVDSQSVQSEASVARGTVPMPLVPGVSADPSIITHHGRYYLIYNKDGFADSIVMRVASSLAELYHARDNVVWTGDRAPAQVKARVGLGAWLLPWNGRWYLYGWGDDGSSVTTSIPFVLESAGDDPLGPYTFKSMFSSPSPEIGGDGHGYAAGPIQVGNRLYLTQTSRGQIFLAELSNPWTLATGWSRILQPAADGWECANGRCLVEGGSAVVRNGKLHLLFSAGGYESPDYCVGGATASADADLRDPSAWTKSDDCVFKRDDTVGAYGPASMIWFTSPDGREDWVVYHVKTTTAPGGGDRALQAKPVVWRPDGTPDIGSPLATGALQRLPSGDPGSRAVEAENGRVRGGRVVQSAFASNGRYVTLAPGDTVTTTITAPRTGSIPLYLWMRSETGKRPRLRLQVNDQGPVDLDVPTGGRSDGFDAGQFAAAAVQLRAGTNTIKLTGVDQVAGIDRLWLNTWLHASGSAAVDMDDRHVVFEVADGRITVTACRDGSCEPLPAPPDAAAPFIGYPAAVSRDGASVDLFAMGADGMIWQTALRGTQWDPWVSRGSPPPGAAPGGLSAVARTPNNLDIYALGTDGRVWSTAWQQGGTWINWFAPDQRGYGVGQVSAPSGAGRRATQIDLASVGTDGHVWLTWWDGRSWNRSYPVGSPPDGSTSAPALASRAPEMFDVVVRGTEGRYWSRTYSETVGWGTWTRIPGDLPDTAVSAPAVTANRATATTTALIRATDGLWSATLGATGWSSWRPLGR